MASRSESHEGIYLQFPSFGERLNFCEDSETFLTSDSRFTLPKVASLASINIFRDGEIFLQKSARRCNGVLLQGPRRLMKLCLFGFIIPALLISVPLYVRLILYPPTYYMMAATDQRLLDHPSSSVWCQGQTVHMNGSFNAFMLPDSPPLQQHFSKHQMLQHMKLKDDVKEYWGFFLQKGSIVSINLCNRYDGGMLMIMRGVHNLKKCAWLGEEDSAEQDEDHKDDSNESGQMTDLIHDYPLMSPGELLMETEKQPILRRSGLKSVEKVNLTSEERKEELEYYINKVLKLSKNRREIIKGLNQQRAKSKLSEGKKNWGRLRKQHRGKLDLDDGNKTEIRQQTTTNGKNESSMIRIKRELETMTENDDAREEFGDDSPKIPIKRRVYLNTYNSSYELSNSTMEHYLSLYNLPKELTYERGHFNQTDLNDTSNEEHRSSFSSSEEALTKCKGLIGVLPLYSSRRCHSFNDSHVNKIRYRIPVTGTYYFVFSSDNEVFDSDLYFNMTLQRVVFNTDSAKESCVNKTDCSLQFSFWSHDQAVVEVPEGDWNAAYTMEIKCQPRAVLYLLFLFLIPIFILFCALH